MTDETNYYTKGEVDKHFLRLGENTIFFKNIGSITMPDEVDVRPSVQKWLFKKEEKEDGCLDILIQGVWIIAVIIAWIAALICLFYVGVEYGLSSFGMQGFISEKKQSELLEASISYVIGIPLVAICFMIGRAISSGLNLRYKFGYPEWEWTLRIGSSDGKDYFLRSRSPKIVYLWEIITDKVENNSSTVRAKFDLSRGILRKEESRLTRTLADAKGLKAIAMLDDGRRIITSEKYGKQGACLGLYDAESLKLLEQIFIDGFEPPSAIGVVSDSNHVIVNVDRSLCVIDLRTGGTSGPPLPMLFHNDGPTDGKPIAWWQYPFLGKKELFRTGTIGVFDGGRIATVHCGIAAPSMPSQLISWDLNSFRLKAGPVRTPDVSPSPQLTDDMAGVPDKIHRQFITGQRYGWVNFWDIDILRLVKAWRVESPRSCDRSLQNCASNQIHSMVLSTDARIIAVGTFCGAIHVIDIESGKDVIAPLVPRDFDYTRERYSDSPRYATEVTALQFFAMDKKLIAGYDDGSLRVWDIESGLEVGDPTDRGEKHGGPIGLLCVLPRSGKVISVLTIDYGSEKSNIQVWDPMGKTLSKLGERNSLRVFLCHASEDKPAIRALHSRLNELGFQPWLDEINLAPGIEWKRAIETAVRESHVILVCVSSASIPKIGFVQKEIRVALDRALEMPYGAIYIVPVRLDKCTLPEHLSEWQAVDLYAEDGESRLIQSLRAKARELALLPGA